MDSIRELREQGKRTKTISEKEWHHTASQRESYRMSTLLLLLLLPFAGVHSQSIQDPLEAYAKSISSMGLLPYQLLIKIEYDFNNDHLTDLALSESSSWGNAGGEWSIYLREANGNFRSIGTLFFHPDAISLDLQQQSRSILRAYIRSNAGEGNLVTYSLSSTGLKKESERLLRPDEQHPSDQAIYTSLFEHSALTTAVSHCLLSDYLLKTTISWQPGYQQTASTVEFGGEVKRSETFLYSFADRFQFVLTPTLSGWELIIREKTHPEENLARLTPPFHSVPNPRDIEGWHFRNAENTDQNNGDVNAPGKKRDFIFSPQVGKLYFYPSSEEALEAIRNEGNGILTITEMKLGNLIKDQQAWFEWMKFTVRLELGKDFGKEPSPEQIWNALLREMILGNEPGVEALSSQHGIESLFKSLPAGETRKERLIRFGTIWQKWETRWRTVDSTTVQISIGPEVKAHLIELKKIDSRWKFNLWLPGE